MITLAHVQEAMALNDFDGHQAQSQMAPNHRRMIRSSAESELPPARDASVLILIYPESDERLHLILTLRQAHLRGHSGQVSFPGGKVDPEDVDYVATALRETCEELSICQTPEMTILGVLTLCYIPPSNFNVQPVVAYSPTRPDWHPNEDEVAEVFTLALDDLVTSDIKAHEARKFGGNTFQVPYYNVKGHKVWGATATMLSDFEQRLQTVIS